MTPFDEGALFAMLTAFYPIVSALELVRARSERPEYFAGGTLGGSKGDKLFLPDTRVFDLIQNAGGLPGTQHWQVIVAGPGGSDSPWPLEAGPLTPLEDVTPTPSGNVGAFEARVGVALDELGASDAVLAAATQSVTEGAGAGALLLGDSSELDDVDRVVEEVSHSRGGDALADIVVNANGLSGAIDTTDRDYDEAPPDPRIPNEPNFPGYPGDDGTDGEPGRENPRHPGGPGNPRDEGV